MQINLLTLLQADIEACPSTHNQTIALKYCAELRQMDCGHITDINIPDGETPRVLETLRQLAAQLPLDLGSRRVRAMRMIEAFPALIPGIE